MWLGPCHVLPRTMYQQKACPNWEKPHKLEHFRALPLGNKGEALSTWPSFVGSREANDLTNSPLCDLFPEHFLAPLAPFSPFCSGNLKLYCPRNLKLYCPLFYSLLVTVSDSRAKRWRREIVKISGDALTSSSVLGTCPEAATITAATAI